VRLQVTSSERKLQCFPGFLVNNKNLEIALLCQQGNMFLRLNTNRYFISLTGSGERRRIARQTPPVTSYAQCSKNVLTYIASCMNKKWDLSCKMQTNSGYYFVTCKNQHPLTPSWVCTKVHLTTHFPVCCDLICPST